MKGGGHSRKQMPPRNQTDHPVQRKTDSSKNHEIDSKKPNKLRHSIKAIILSSFFLGATEATARLMGFTVVESIRESWQEIIAGWTNPIP